jgi:hypothetical protein
MQRLTGAISTGSSALCSMMKISTLTKSAFHTASELSNGPAIALHVSVCGVIQKTRPVLKKGPVPQWHRP